MAWTQVKSKMPPGMAPAAFNFGGCTFSGKVVTFCGITADSPAPTTRTYQVDASGNWTVMTTSGTAPAARHGHAVEQCGPTKMILFGGSSTPDNAAGSLSNEVFTLNLGLKSWMKPRVTGDLPAVAHHRTAMVGGNSNLVSVGGMLSGGNATADVYVLNMTRMSWTKSNATGAVPEPRYMHCVVPVPGSADTVVVFGGTDGSKFFNDTLTFNIASNTWTALPAKGEAPCARANAGHGVVGGTMYVFGGRAAGGALLDDLWGLEIASGTWTCYAKDGGAWPSARDGHVLLPVGGSNMMLVGGQDPSSVFTLNTTKVGGGSASPAPGTPSSARRTTSPAPATTSPAPVDHSAEEARKKAAAEEEARKKAAAEEEARKKAAAAAEEEARKKAAAAAEEERKKAAAAAAAAEEEARKAVAAASAADASAAEKEAAMKKAEEAAAARKKADEEAAAAARKKAEDDAAAAARKKAEDDAAAARKKTEDAAAARKKAEDDAAAARKKAEEAAAARKKLEEEAAAARKKAEEDAARRKAEAEEESRRKAAQRVSASAAPVNVDSAALQAAQERIAELEELLEAANARIADLEAQVASGGSGGGEECSGGPPPPPPPPPPMGMGRGRLPTAMDEEGGGAGGPPPPPPPPPPPGGMKMPGSPRPGPMGGAGRGDLLAQIAAGRKLKHAVVAPRPELPVEKTPPAGAKAAAGGVSMDDILKIQARLKKKREENSSLDKKLEGRPSPKELEERNIIHEPALPKLRSTGNVLQERLAHRPSPEEVEASGITDFGAKLKKSETKKADAPAAPQVETDFGTKLRRSETRKSDTQAVAAQIDFRTVLKPGAKD